MNDHTRPQYSADDWDAVYHFAKYYDYDAGLTQHPGGVGILGVRLSANPDKPGKWHKDPSPYRYWENAESRAPELDLPGGKFETGQEMVYRGAMPRDIFEKCRNDGDMIGAIPWHFGLAAIDVDKDDIMSVQDKCALVVRKYGTPLGSLWTGSGGAHIIYPIRKGDAATAYQRWTPRSFSINGIKIGEICCASRYAFIWNPIVWGEAIAGRQRMADSDIDSAAKFLNHESIEWATPAATGTRLPTSLFGASVTPPNPDIEQAKLAAIIKTLALRPKTDKPDRYEGACPGCGGETRFNAGIFEGRLFARCWVCHGTTYNHPELINQIGRDAGVGAAPDDSEPNFTETEWLESIEPITLPEIDDFMPGGKRFDQHALDFFVKQSGIITPVTIESADKMLADARSQIEKLQAEIEERMQGLADMVGKKLAQAIADNEESEREIEYIERQIDAISAIRITLGGVYANDRPVHPLLLVNRYAIIRPLTQIGEGTGYAMCAEHCATITDWWWGGICGNQPESTLIETAKAAARSIGANFDIPESEVRTVLKAPAVMHRMAGGSASDADTTMTQGKTAREQERLHVPTSGSEPNAKAKMAGKTYSPRNKGAEAFLYMINHRVWKDVKKAGGIVSPRLLKTEDSQDLAYILRRTGATAIYNFVDGRYEITHPAITGWGGGDDSYITYSHLARLTQLINLASRNFLTAHDLSGTKRLDARSLRGSYAVESGLIGWSGKEKTIFALLGALKGTDIEVVDVMSDWTRSIIAKHQAASPEYIGQCLNLAQRVLLEVDGFQPVAGQEDLAIEAGQILYATLMTRRLEALKAVETGNSPVETQRYVPILFGEKGVAKTTFGKLIVPTAEHLKPELGAIRDDVLKAAGGVFEHRVAAHFQFTKRDNNDALRQLVGKAVVINDELRGMADALPEDVKGLITLTQGEYHAKYENYREIRRSDVMLGTTNKTGAIPTDEALRDRLVVTELQKQYPNESDTATGMRVARWMCKHYEMLFIGGLEMAYLMQRGELSMEPSVSQALRSHVIDSASDESISIEERILDLVAAGEYSWQDSKGVKWLSFNRIAQAIYTLRYTQDVHVEPGRPDGLSIKGLDSVLGNRANEEIKQDAGLRMSNEFDKTDAIMLGDEFSPWVKDAIKARLGKPGRKQRGETNERDRILDAMQSLVEKASFAVEKRVPYPVAARWLNGVEPWAWASKSIGTKPRCAAIRLDDQMLQERLAELLFGAESDEE